VHQPKEIHLQAALRIVQYLKGTLGNGILYKRKRNVNLELIQMLTMLGQMRLKNKVR